MRKAKKIIFSGLLVALCYALWWGSMNYAGYCHAEGRFLSDDEKIKSAVQFVLDGYPPSIKRTMEISAKGSLQKREYWYTPKQPIKYKDVQEFFALNPGCCALGMRTGEGRKPDIMDRMTGYLATYVIVRYKVRYFDEDNIERYSPSGEVVAVKNCGKSWTGI